MGAPHPGRGRAPGRGRGRGRYNSRGGRGTQQIREPTEVCPRYEQGLCTRPHYWLRPRHGGNYCQKLHQRPGGMGQWIVNQGLSAQDAEYTMGWTFGGLLEDPNAQSKMAYRRVGVTAIKKLRSQYGQVMSGIDRNSVEGGLFYARPDESTAQLWTDASGDDLTKAVFSVRMVVERLAFLAYRAENAVTYLRGDDKERRWATLRFNASSLVRGAGDGPDGPIQWSGHGQQNPHSYTEVTERSIIEIVAKLGVILEVLFAGRLQLPRDVGVLPRAVAPALIAAFSAPSIRKDEITTTARGTPDGRQAHNNPRGVFATLLERSVEDAQLVQQVAGLDV